MSTILILDSAGFKGLPPKEVLHGLFGDKELICVSTVDAAKRIVAHTDIDMLITNNPSFQLIMELRDRQKTQIILATDLPMQDYSNHLHKKEDSLLDHVIAMRSQGSWGIHDLRITVAKILTPNQIFGIEKYMAPGTEIFRNPITGTKDREVLNTTVMEYASSCKLGQHTSKMAFGITEELLMNTIHDAPLAAGITDYCNLPRGVPVELKPAEYGELSFAFDGRIMAIGASDPFGALKKEKLFEYLKKVLKRKDSIGLIDTKKGGAGLGFFKILYSSHGLVCNVLPGSRTEIIALIDVDEQLRDFTYMTRSIHYFQGV